MMDIILSIFFFLQTRRKLTDMYFNGFVAFSACDHKIVVHADDVRIIVTLLAVMNLSFIPDRLKLEAFMQ